MLQNDNALFNPRQPCYNYLKEAMVDRVVTFYTRGPGFKSSREQHLVHISLLFTLYWKDENKEKEAVMVHLKNHFVPSLSRKAKQIAH